MQIFPSSPPEASTVPERLHLTRQTSRWLSSSSATVSTMAFTWPGPGPSRRLWRALLRVVRVVAAPARPAPMPEGGLLRRGLVLLMLPVERDWEEAEVVFLVDSEGVCGGWVGEVGERKGRS